MKYKVEVSRTQIYEFEVEAESEVEARHLAMDQWEAHAPVANHGEVAAFEVTEEAQS